MKEKIGNSGIQKFLRSEISFYITAATLILALAGSYYGTTNQLNLLDQRLAFYIENSNKEISDLVLNQNNLETRLLSMEKELVSLNAKFSALQLQPTK